QLFRFFRTVSAQTKNCRGNRPARGRERPPVSCPLPPHIGGPDAIPAGRDDAVGIDAVLDLLMEAQQRVAVERILTHQPILERGAGAVTAPAVFGAAVHYLREQFAAA